MKTLTEQLERNARDFAEKAAIIYRGQKVSYRELLLTVNRAANILSDLDIHHGSRVGLLLPSMPELIISFLGTAKAGGVVTPVNFRLPPEEIQGILNSVSLSCLIIHDSFMDIVKKAVPANAKIPVIVVGEQAGRYLSWDNLLRAARTDFSTVDIHEDSVVYLNYTSGSGGEPKGAVTRHSHIYWNTFAAVNALGLTSADVHLCMFAPFAHPHEIFARALFLGGTMVLVEKAYPKSIAEAISHHNVTCMMGLSPMYEQLLELLRQKHYDLGSLRIPESGGMHTRTEIIEAFQQKVGVPIIPVWGSTETTGIAIANRPGRDIPRGSIGTPCPTYEVKIVDENDEEVRTGQIGEMLFKGPAVVQGYFAADRLNTRESFCNGWYYSEDLGKRDEQGNFYFAGRKSGMMKVAGLKVYPMEVEMALLDHPDIQEAAVIAAQDKLRGEVPKAIIVTKSGNALTEKELAAFFKERLALYKIPRIVETRPALPKIGSGKINKRMLQMECKG